MEKSYDYFFEKRADFFDVSPQKSYFLTLKKVILTIAKSTNRVFFSALSYPIEIFLKKQNGGFKITPARYNFLFSQISHIWIFTDILYFFYSIHNFSICLFFISIKSYELSKKNKEYQ